VGLQIMVKRKILLQPGMKPWLSSPPDWPISIDMKSVKFVGKYATVMRTGLGFCNSDSQQLVSVQQRMSYHSLHSEI
jgi:hypothetical protein